MPSAAVPVDAQRLPSPALRRFAWGVLVYFIAVILWGTLVRATGSGAGCGDHWPLCNGTGDAALAARGHHHRVYPPHHQRHFVLPRRGPSGVDVCGHGARTSGARGRRRHGRRSRCIEAILGAFLVKLGLTAQSQSPLRPPYLALHLTNTLLLLAALTLTAHMLSRTAGLHARQHPLVAPFGAIAAVIVVMIVGVTGSLAALGDTLFPATSLGSALAQDFSSTSGWLVRWRWTHPTVAFVASIFLIWLLVRAAQRTAHWDNRGLSALVLLLLAAQYVLGVLDVVLLAPVWLQVAHLLGADAFGPRWWFSRRG